MKGLATFCGDLECFVLKIDLLLTVLSDFKREAAHDDVFLWVMCMTHIRNYYICNKSGWPDKSRHVTWYTQY